MYQLAAASGADRRCGCRAWNPPGWSVASLDQAEAQQDSSKET
jgi:hypothetical protein